MTFDVNARSADILAPVHAFPGDESLDPAIYPRTIFSGYMSSAVTVYGAALGFGVEVDAETFERWKRLGAAAGLVDDFLDESADIKGSSADFEQGLAKVFAGDELPDLSEVDPRLTLAVQLLRNSVAVLPEQRQERLLEAARHIGRIAVRKVQCDTLETYFSILREEAAESSVLIAESVSEEIKSQPPYDRFRHWCANAIALGTFADSSRDMWQDHAQGRIALRASWLGSAALAGRMLPFAHDMLSPRENRRATLWALRARLRFSKLPTALLVRRSQKEYLISNFRLP